MLLDFVVTHGHTVGIHMLMCVHTDDNHTDDGPYNQ